MAPVYQIEYVMDGCNLNLSMEQRPKKLMEQAQDAISVPCTLSYVIKVLNFQTRTAHV